MSNEDNRAMKNWLTKWKEEAPTIIGQEDIVNRAWQGACEYKQVEIDELLRLLTRARRFAFGVAPLGGLFEDINEVLSKYESKKGATHD